MVKIKQQGITDDDGGGLTHNTRVTRKGIIYSEPSLRPPGSPPKLDPTSVVQNPSRNFGQVVLRERKCLVCQYPAVWSSTVLSEVLRDSWNCVQDWVTISTLTCFPRQLL